MEDVDISGDLYRRLIFFSNKNLIQSEARLVRGQCNMSICFLQLSTAVWSTGINAVISNSFSVFYSSVNSGNILLNVKFCVGMLNHSFLYM